MADKFTSAVLLEGDVSIEGNRLIHSLKLKVAAGGWTCLLGGSGTGKSTLLRLIAHLPVHAELNGSLTSPLGLNLKRDVAYMAQQDLLLPWANVSENVALGSRIRGEKVDQERLNKTLNCVGLYELRTKRPRELSGGQRQRVALARTLIENRPLVLLDEPFSALDARTREEMQNLSAELLKKRSVLIVTHDPLEAARLGDQLYILSANGAELIKAPKGVIPRNTGDISTLKCQSSLLEKLKGQA